VPRSRPTYRRINLRACANSWDTLLKSQPVSRYEIYVIRAITRDSRLSMRARSLIRSPRACNYRTARTYRDNTCITPGDLITNRSQAWRAWRMRSRRYQADVISLSKPVYRLFSLLFFYLFIYFYSSLPTGSSPRTLRAIGFRLRESFTRFPDT